MSESTSLVTAMTDDSCRVEFTQIVPPGRDTTECDSADWSAEVKQEILPVVKQEPEEVLVSCAVYYFLYVKRNATVEADLLHGSNNNMFKIYLLDLAESTWL